MSVQPISYYHHGKAGWQKISWYELHEKQRHKPTFVDSNFNTLKIATFNVLFDIFEDIEPAICSKLRIPFHFTDILPNIDADVLALQEVTNMYLSQLCSQAWVKEKYPYMTSFTDKTEFTSRFDQRNFFTVILSRIPIKELYLFKIEANRPIPVAVLQPNPEQEFTVASLHLKAGQDSDSIRKKQLEHLFQLFGVTERTLQCFSADNLKVGGGKKKGNQPQKNLAWKEFQNTILVGDFNFQLEHEEKFIPKQVVDAWKLLKPDEIGYTCDADRNIMIHKQAQLKGKIGGSDRFDRILLLPKNKNAIQSIEWTPRSITMFAEDPLPIPNKNNEVFASDHFGLRAEIDCRKI